MRMNIGQVVFTNKARCRDCYRCIRVCPVKAIEMKNGQASVIEELCIDCGTCILNCPQNAKTYRHDIDAVSALIASGKKVAISVAPAFAGLYSESERKNFPTALRLCGFQHISETAFGAWYSSIETKRQIDINPDKSLIASACPAIVNLIEKHKPELVDNLAQAASPMIAHARIMKQDLGDDWEIVFVGPCVAKKSETKRASANGVIAAVITFDELNEYLKDNGIILEKLAPSKFDDIPSANARIYPLTGGLLKTAQLETDMLAQNIIGVSGINDVLSALDLVKNSTKNVFIEPLFCSQGCLNGPGIHCDTNIFERRANLIEYAKNAESNDGAMKDYNIDFSYTYEAKQLSTKKQYSDKEIAAVLEKTGNSDESEQLNCQACGYHSCKDKAIAVLDGMAEIEMCIPYMRRKAELRGDIILESSPNAIVILDEHLRIITTNPAFKKNFMCSESIAGKPISYLMDPEPFVRIATNSDVDHLELTVKHEKYGLVCHQIIYELKNEHQYVGIFVNITKNLKDKNELFQIRQNTLSQARELLNHQISMAQNIAKLLGESTARGEALVEDILQFADEDNSKNNAENEKDWLWNMYTLE